MGDTGARTFLVFQAEVTSSSVITCDQVPPVKRRIRFVWKDEFDSGSVESEMFTRTSHWKYGPGAWKMNQLKGRCEITLLRSQLKLPKWMRSLRNGVQRERIPSILVTIPRIFLCT